MKTSMEIKLIWNLIYPMMSIYDINLARSMDGELRASNFIQNFKTTIHKILL